MATKILFFCLYLYASNLFAVKQSQMQSQQQFQQQQLQQQQLQQQQQQLQLQTSASPRTYQGAYNSDSRGGVRDQSGAGYKLSNEVIQKNLAKAKVKAFKRRVR
jgi:type II secretory pathway pseudopilin PulG